MLEEKLSAKLEEVRQGKSNMQKAIASLDKQKEQAVANLNAFIGAEQVLLQLIDELQKSKEEVAKDAADNS